MRDIAIDALATLVLYVCAQRSLRWGLLLSTAMTRCDAAKSVMTPVIAHGPDR